MYKQKLFEVLKAGENSSKLPKQITLSKFLLKTCKLFSSGEQKIQKFSLHRFRFVKIFKVIRAR